MQSSFKKIIFCLLMLLVSTAWATHNRSGEIRYKRIPPYAAVNGSPLYTYSITVVKFFNDGQQVADRCQDTVYFGDGTRGIAPRINGTSGCASGCSNCGEIIEAGMKRSIYSTVHTYSTTGFFTVSSSDRNRNTGVNNIPNSDQVPFYIEALIVIYPTGVNSSPVFALEPVYKGMVGSCFEINPFAFDADGDSLSYELIPCMSAPNQTVAGFTLPATGANGTFSVDAVTGLISWCNPQVIDQFNIALRVKEWRRPYCGAPPLVIGYVVRDMQLLTVNSVGSVLTLTTQGLGDACVVAGNTYSSSITAASVPSSYVGASLFIGGAPSLSYTIGPSGFVTTFTWQTTCLQARSQPHLLNWIYLVTYGIQGNYRNFYRQKNLWVVPPAPTVYNVVKDTSKVTLHWTPLSQCLPNLQAYQIYRKVGTNSWAHGSCETGLPASSGFQSIGFAAATDSTFADIDLWNVPNGSTVNYAVIAVTSDCAESFADNVQTLSVIVGLKHETQNYANVKVYPNPFTSAVKVSLGDNYTGKAEAALYSADGKMVYQVVGTALSGEINLQLHDLAPGVYLLQLKTGKGVVNTRLARQ